ncbi:hypothetical protein Tco_0144776 [Tanacetum coccineum]
MNVILILSNFWYNQSPSPSESNWLRLVRVGDVSTYLDIVTREGIFISRSRINVRIREISEIDLFECLKRRRYCHAKKGTSHTLGTLTGLTLGLGQGIFYTRLYLNSRCGYGGFAMGYSHCHHLHHNWEFSNNALLAACSSAFASLLLSFAPSLKQSIMQGSSQNEKRTGVSGGVGISRSLFLVSVRSFSS